MMERINRENNASLIKKDQIYVNRAILVAWAIINVILAVAYLVEVIKGDRTPLYYGIFVTILWVPLAVSCILFKKKPDSRNLRYIMATAYFAMYAFVMTTGNTLLVFVYILPMSAMLVLYHQVKLILGYGIATIVLNIGMIVWWLFTNTVEDSGIKDLEIQMAVLILYFGCAYLTAKVYDKSYKANVSYIDVLSDKNDQINRMTFETIEAISSTIDAKDEYTKGHSNRVAEYSVIIAKEMGIGEDKLSDIRYIALLHDIGKIGVPDAILKKKGRLDDQEYEEMKRHTVAGESILSGVGTIPDLMIGAKYHHERFDGKGYPSGLSGENIPFIARIIAVADAFDAMTTDRVYRKRLPPDVVMAELEKGRGTQFDPKVVQAFINYLDSHKELLNGSGNDS
ncbi:MAG: HD-GYP domain-containing protein [Oscillospiraceae bacterium]|nr:HD-GYP domain-containing protein [Oscillospiraceae bacterium]